MDIPTTFSDVLEKANDGRSAELGEAISKLLNEEWAKLSEALSAEGMPPVVSLSFSPNHDKLIAILEQYIRFDDSDEIFGSIDNMNLIASIYSTVNPETGEDDLSIDVDYYYGDTEFQPALYNGRELRDGEKIKRFDHIPTTIDIIKMCIEFNSGTPLFDIDKNAPFYDSVAPFLGGDKDEGTDTLGGEDEPYPREEKRPKIEPQANVPRPIIPSDMENRCEEEDAGDSDECRTCDPTMKCPTCESRENCAAPCYLGDDKDCDDKDDPAESSEEA